jgi:hypothetical protein
VESSVGQGELGLTELLMGKEESGFEFGPVFVRRNSPFPELAFVMEKAPFENDLVGDGGDLRGSVRAIAGSSKVDGFFDLVKEHFNGGWLAP